MPTNTAHESELLKFPLGKEEQHYLRHRWHHILLVLSTLTTVLVIVIAVALAAALSGSTVFEKFLSVEDYDQLTGAVILVLFAPFIFLLLRTVNSAKFSATGAVATEQQFEYVHLIVEHYSKLAGLPRTPMIAIVAGADFTAKTVANFGKAVILVHSDLLDAPRPGSDDWGALRFAIAREIGHIAAGHRTLLYELCTAVTQSIPYASHPLRRAEAYTADRYGAVLAPEAASDYFAVDAVSKDCWQDMSTRAAIARAGKVKFGQMITGLIGEVPPTPWRFQTLAWLGIFLCEPVPSHTNSPEDYRNYLENLPLWPIRIADLEKHYGAFLFPPKPMPEETLDKLCPRGTNLERLSRAFSTHATTVSDNANKEDT